MSRVIYDDEEDFLSHYFFALAWGAIVCLSFWGWGRSAEFFICKKNTVSAASQTALGISTIIFLGGILNAIGFLTKTALISIIVLGILFHLLVEIFKARSRVRSKEKKRYDIPVYILLAVGVTFFIGFVARYRFNSWDDPMAYFAFIKKIVQTGFLGEDPFSERRLVTQLGAHYILQSFLLLFLSFENLHIIDPGLAVVMVAFLIYLRAKDKGLSPWKSFSVGILPLILPVFPVNASAQFLPLALNLSLLDFLGDQHPISKKNRMILTALLAAGACALKTNWILPTLSVWFTFIAFSLENKKTGLLAGEFLGAMLMVLLFLSPYMIALYKSSGTMLFPLFGRGFHASSYGLAFSENTIESYKEILYHIIKHPYFNACWIAIVIFFIHTQFNHTSTKAKKTVLAISFSHFVLPALLILVIALSKGRGLGYGYVAFLGCILIVLIEILAVPRSYVGYRSGFLFWFVTLFFLSFHSYQIPQSYRHAYDGLKEAFSGKRLVSREESIRCQTMQHCLPKGETMLAVLSNCYLLDFARNKVLIADFPGSTSPPPGWPVLSEGEELANYLRRQSVRYVAFDQGGWPKLALNAKRITDPASKRPRDWIDTEFVVFSNAIYQLEQLKQTRRRLYDDGDLCLIDLETGASMAHDATRF